MFYTVYKTTNLINGKFYIGTHKTNDPNDNYMGSGTLLRRAIEKHGRENFRKDVLFVFDNPIDMFAKEAELVDEEFLMENNTYNLKLGGCGGFDWINSNTLVRLDNNRKGREAMMNVLNSRGASHSSDLPGVRDKLRRAAKERCRDGRMKVSEAFTFLGKHHSAESKARIGAANSVKQKGAGNCQYGTMWITDEVSSKKIKSSDQIPDGWRRGRVVSKMSCDAAGVAVSLSN